MNFNVKITCGSECRRFSFSKQETFASFVQIVKNLFERNEDSLNVLYLDDEKEWVKISTELEWTHLVQNVPLFNNALRVRVEADKAKKPAPRCESAEKAESASGKRQRKFCRKGAEQPLPFLHQIMQQISQFKPVEVDTSKIASASNSAQQQQGGFVVGKMINEALAAINKIQGKHQEEVKEQLEKPVQPDVLQTQPAEQQHSSAEVVQAEYTKQEPAVEQPVAVQQVEPEPVVIQPETTDLPNIVAPPSPAPEQQAVIYPTAFVYEDPSTAPVKQVQPDPEPEPQPQPQPEPEPYSNELVSLEMMGFTNKPLNMHLLKHFKGDMAKAIDSLLNM